MNPEEPCGDQLRTLIQLHNYFRGVSNHSETVAKIIATIEDLILKMLKEVSVA
jgi:hypothetical protein